MSLAGFPRKKPEKKQERPDMIVHPFGTTFGDTGQPPGQRAAQDEEREALRAHEVDEDAFSWSKQPPRSPDIIDGVLLERERQSHMTPEEKEGEQRALALEAGGWARAFGTVMTAKMAQELIDAGYDPDGGLPELSLAMKRNQEQRRAQKEAEFDVVEYFRQERELEAEMSDENYGVEIDEDGWLEDDE